LEMDKSHSALQQHGDCLPAKAADFRA
jgi:hypothetical protein